MANKPDVPQLTPEQAPLFWNAYSNMLAKEAMESPDAPAYDKTSMYVAADSRFMGYIEAYTNAAPDLTEWHKAAILDAAAQAHEEARQAAFDADFMGAKNYALDLATLSDDMYWLVENPDVAGSITQLGDLAEIPMQGAFALPPEPLFMQAYEALKINNPDLVPYVESRSGFSQEIRAAYENMDVTIKVPKILATSDIRFAALDVIDENNKELIQQADSFYTDLNKGAFPAVAQLDTPAKMFDFEELEEQQDPVILASLTKKLGIPDSEIIVAATDDRDITGAIPTDVAPQEPVTPDLETALRAYAAKYRADHDIPEVEATPVIFAMAPVIPVEVKDLPPLPHTESEIQIAAAPVIPVEIHDLPPLETPEPPSTVALFRAAVDSSEIMVTPEAAASDDLWANTTPASTDAPEATEAPELPALKNYIVHSGDFLGKIIGNEYGLKPGDVGYQETLEAIAAIPENATLFADNAHKAHKNIDDYILYPQDKIKLPVMGTAEEVAEAAPKTDNDPSEIFKVKGSLSQTVWRAAVNEYHIDMTGLDVKKIYEKVGELNNLEDIGKVAKDQPLYIPRSVFEHAPGPA